MIARAYRFHGHASLGYAHKQGKVIRGPQLTLKYAVNQRRQQYRAAVVVSRKVDKSAVVRNRIRRRIYEIIRQHQDQILQPHDLIFMVFSNILADMESNQLQRLVTDQLRKAGVVTSANSGGRAIVKRTEKTE